jgi:hypothetical protein
MDNLFLPREVGSIETGPQNFVGTDVLNTTIYFTFQPEELDLINSVVVSNAGLNRVNGVFNYTAEVNNKLYYNKNGDPFLFIAFLENTWGIYDFLENAETAIYFGGNFENNYPWNVTSWSSLNSIYNPVPTVTKVL